MTSPGLLDCLSLLAFQLPSQQSPIASSSSLASISTPLDKEECAEIQSLYLGIGSSVWLPILQASQPNMALLVCQILPTLAKVLSSPIASFSIPDDKAKCAKIRDLYLRIGSSFWLPILQASQPNIALLVCQILPTWSNALSSPITSFSTPDDKAKCAKIHKLYLGN